MDGQDNSKFLQTSIARIKYYVDVSLTILEVPPNNLIEHVGTVSL